MPNTNIKKNILFLTNWYPNKTSPSFALFIKKHAQAISKEQPLQVLALSIVYNKVFYKKEAERYLDEDGVETHHIFLESRFYKLLYLLLPLQYLILKRYIRKNIQPEFSFDVIHSNVLFPCAIVGKWLSSSFKTKLVISEHWSKLDKFFRVSLYRWAGKRALNKASVITCVSENLRNTVRKYTSNKRIEIVPNVVSTRQFYPDPNIAQSEMLTFIAVAHWAAPKNPFLFLNALQDLCKEDKLGPLKMVLVGTGRQLDQIRQAGYPFEIEYKGNLKPAELNIEFNKSHIFLHGSDFETFSVVIAEALLSGTPIIASPVGIAPEVICSTNGYIASAAVDDWKDKILKACGTVYNRRAIAAGLGNRYSPEAIGNEFSRLYELPD